MLYVDFVWDLNTNMIVPDMEIDTSKLNWKEGDFWQVQERHGQLVFCKVDPLMQFLMEGTTSGRS